MKKINFNRNYYFGENCITNLSKEILEKGYERAFVITDNNIISLPIFQAIANELEKAHIFSDLFCDINNEPKISDVKNAYNAFCKSNCDFIIAVGGGSVIDTAKAVSIIAENPHYADVSSLSGERNDVSTCLDLIAIVTTSGSGAEISKSIVISDELRRKKIICYCEKAIPQVCFADTKFLCSMPDITTLSSGFDALAHAIESLISNKANPLSKALANDAIDLVINNLPICYDDANNLEARENMAYASYLAALSYSNSGLGICHSLAHAVADKINIPHGIALAIILPAVLKFNMYGAGAKDFKYIASAFNQNFQTSNLEESCRTAIKCIESFRNDFNIPTKLSDYGLKESQIDIVALNAFEDVCTSQNSRPCTTTDLYSILKKLI